MPPRIFARGEKLEDGHYTVLEELGVGGMGVVYHCRDELLLRDVAIKMLLPSLMADKKNLDVFKEEARLAAQLEHPNIVTVYDIGVESRQGRDHHFVAMEYLPGGNLAARVTQGPLPLEHSLNWMKQLASGLSFAHKRGVIHQDIKADNIFITNEGDLKIGDFGLARLLVGRVYLNSATKGMGTPAYMSPELCRGEQQDHRSDIYSMGILFFEMCTGQLPYRAQGMIEMAMKHTSAPVPSAKRLNPLIPDVLDKVIKRMMAKTPDERYRSMTDVLGIVDDLIFELRVARMGLSGKLENRKLLGETGENQALSESAARSISNAAAQAKAQSAAQNQPLSQEEIKNRDLPDDKQKILRQSRGGEKKETTKVVARTSQPNSAGEPLKAMPAPGKDADKESGKVSDKSSDKISDKQTDKESEKKAESKSGTSSSSQQNMPAAGGARNTNSGSIFGGGISGSGARITPTTSQVRWSFSTHGPVGWCAAPVLNREGTVVYFPSSDGRLYALGAEDGSLVFSYDAGSPLIGAPIYMPDKLVLSDCSGRTHALDPQSGQLIWQYDGPAPVLSSPAIYANTILVADKNGQVAGLDVRTGRKLWTFNAPDAIVSQPKVHGDSLYIGTRGGSVHSLACVSGRQNWKYQASGRIVSSPITSVDTVYVGTQSGSFFALDAEAGRLIWEYPCDGAINRGGIIVFTSVMFASQGKWLYCCEKYDGSLKWKAPLKNKPAATLMHVGSINSLVISLSKDGFLEAFDTMSGAVRWRVSLRKEVESHPLIAGNRLYLGSVDGEISCLEFNPGEKPVKVG